MELRPKARCWGNTNDIQCVTLLAGPQLAPHLVETGSCACTKRSRSGLSFVAWVPFLHAVFAEAAWRKSIIGLIVVLAIPVPG
jgi:hypothetical protein